MSPDWQERITRETAPAIQAEHTLRYGAAAPLVFSSDVWVDLGCGNGVAAAAAFGAERPARAVLVDVAAEAVEQAAAELGMPHASQLACDLTDPDDLRRIGAAISSGGGSVVTCFEVVEHLGTFLPLLEWAKALVDRQAATVVISVPNDAFWSIQNPHHLTSWGSGAFDELCGLLPAERTLLRQVPLSGSLITEWDEPSQTQTTVHAGGQGTVPSHFLAAFGARHRELRTDALVVQAELTEQRRWERQRENDLALMQRAIGEQEATILRQRDELRAQTAEFDEWRTYIHELERELGRPLSGSAGQEPAAAVRGDERREPAT